MDFVNIEGSSFGPLVSQTRTVECEEFYYLLMCFSIFLFERDLIRKSNRAPLLPRTHC